MAVSNVLECQSCGNEKLEQALSLGYIPPSNTLPLRDERLGELTYYPLQMFHCSKCHLVQLGYEVRQDIVFPADYPFLSGITKALRDNFAELVSELKKFIPLGKEHRILDIGSNDGTLLSAFKSIGVETLGVEPTDTNDVAEKQGFSTVKAFFNSHLAQKISRENGQFDVVTITNVLAHAQGLNDFLYGVTQVLKPKGMVAVEVHSIKSMIQNVQFDKITHEHRRYFSLSAMQQLLKNHELDIVYSQWIPSHGGSLRVFAARSGTYPVANNLKQMLSEEDDVLQGGRGLKEFSQQVLDVKVGLQSLIGEVRRQGHRIYGIGAPSRAFALMQIVGIDHFYLDCVLEVSNSLKLGRLIPGTYIPILDERILFEDQPEYAMMLSWHVAKEVMPKLRAKGFKGKFILPLPQPRIADDV